MDDDVTWEKDYAEIILQTFKEYPAATSITGMEGENSGFSKYYSLFAKIFFLGTFTNSKGSYIRRSGFPSYSLYTKNIIQEKIFDTRSCSIKKSNIGNHRFDEKMGSYSFMEDVDFSVAIGKTSIILRNPKAVYHHNHSPGGRINNKKLQSKVVFNHYYIFRKHLSSNILNIPAFIISNVGLVIIAIFNAAKHKDFTYVSGTFIGLKMTIQHLLFNKFPEQ